MLKQLQELAEYALFRSLREVVRHLPYRWFGPLGRGLGRVAFLAGIRKTVTMDNLTHAFPSAGRAQLERIARGAYANYSISLLDFFWLAAHGSEEVQMRVTPMNDDGVVGALQEGKGVVFLSGHFGSWELLVASYGIKMRLPILIVVQEQRNRRIDEVIDHDRRKHGNLTVPMSQSVREVLKTLDNGGVVGMLGDQSGPKESSFVEFFGRPCATHRGVAAFSVKRDAPVFMAFCIRQPDGNHIAQFEEIDRSDLGGTPEEQIEELTRRHTALLEQYVRKYPDHWLWMHKRWKHTGYYQAHFAENAGRPVREGA